jgi:hypothetical protein
MHQSENSAAQGLFIEELGRTLATFVEGMPGVEDMLQLRHSKASTRKVQAEAFLEFSRWLMSNMQWTGRILRSCTRLDVLI